MKKQSIAFIVIIVILPIYFIVVLPSYIDGRIRMKYVRAYNDMLDIASFIDRNKADVMSAKGYKTLYPIGKNTVDPFSGIAYEFFCSSNKAKWILISPGPNKRMDVLNALKQEGKSIDSLFAEPHGIDGAAQYFVLNGISSDGDIIFTDSITPDTLGMWDINTKFQQRRSGHWVRKNNVLIKE